MQHDTLFFEGNQTLDIEGQMGVLLLLGRHT